MKSKRIFDLTVSLISLIILSPVFLIIMLLLWLDSKGPVFYLQKRVGLNHHEFDLFKFRTMRVGSDKLGLLTVGNRDNRITRIGYYLRKYKADELPQLLNILKGDMSFVGPRPEVGKYVAMYTPTQRRVLSIKPGITDWASIRYIDENQLLAASENPEVLYVQTIMPSKVDYNLNYIDHNNLWIDLKIITLTLLKVVSR